MLKIKDILHRIQGNRLLFLLGALGILLLLFSGESKTEEIRPPTEQAEAYRVSLEERLTALCTEIEGVGTASVFLTLSSTEIAVYEKNLSGENETVASSGGEGLLIAYRMPEIQGVTVVCDGGSDPTVQKELFGALKHLLGIGGDQIHIAPRK